MSYQTEFRDAMIDCLRRELVGPDVGPGETQEVLQESPRQRYSAGVLFPCQQPFVENEDARSDEAVETSDEASVDPEIRIEEQPAEPRRAGGSEEASDSAYDETIRLANAFFPSAMGVTFITTRPEDGLVVEAAAAVYSSVKPASPDKLREWHRKPVEMQPVAVKFGRGDITTQEYKLSESLSLWIIYRWRQDGTAMVTTSMVNTKSVGGNEPPSAADCFFQSGFRVRHPHSHRVFREYHTSVSHQNDPEDLSLELLYRRRRAFAVGHGCAADWGDEEDNCAGFVATSSMPVYKVAPVEPTSAGGEELSMFFLAGANGEASSDSVAGKLEELPNSYSRWLDQLDRELLLLPERLRARAGDHLATCRKCLDRMRAGIGLLRDDNRAMTAFMLANRAMLMQQYHSRRGRRGLNAAWVDFPEDYRPQNLATGRWRSFQLAFILINLQSMLPDSEEKSHPERDIVDLIWFPTGGGKTEAYLGLAAYTIFLRRLFHPSNAGCTVLMRYTLRLLTAQQFQRASSLICACETIRCEDPERLGSERISIGLWVGQSLSPNTREEAVLAANALAREDPQVENPFQILTCPWCGTEMDNPECLGYVPVRSPRTVQLRCPDRKCPFSTSASSLPVLVVDEDIYDSPPTLLIGTVDKFAMLAWRENASSIFGIGPTRNDPPDLIIQDELHLIAGPLGSVVGLYEGIIDLLCSSKGRPPKLVASTATIRRAEQQCRALYDREVAQFPPPGLDIADSFFARENPDSPGRVYVGVFASAAPSFVTALIRTAGGLLQGCRSLPLPDGADEKVRDPYWTLLQYFSSLRELGHAATLVEADIPEYMWAIASRSRIPKELCRHLGAPVELTSRRSAQEIPEILERLKVSYPKEAADDVRPLDTLLATNMISVGVDVDRLGLMILVGQPKTTSEYIQASSRVGRSAAAPGLIVTLFNPAKPRDRSHFEHFRAYHSSFYKYVEPTSVTPYSIPAIERALHAVLVIAMRHICGLVSPDQINVSDKGLASVLEFLQARSQRIDAEHSPLLTEKLNQLLRKWNALKPGEWGRFGSPPEGRPLMYPAGTEPRQEWDDLSWPTPSSMRSVDIECEATVLGVYG